MQYKPLRATLRGVFIIHLPALPIYKTHHSKPENNQDTLSYLTSQRALVPPPRPHTKPASFCANVQSVQSRATSGLEWQKYHQKNCALSCRFVRWFCNGRFHLKKGQTAVTFGSVMHTVFTLQNVDLLHSVHADFQGKSVKKELTGKELFY